MVIQTYIIYMGLLLFLFFFAKKAEAKNQKRYVYVIIIILGLVAGLRKNTVGIDTQGYLSAFENIINGKLRLAYGMEWSFRYICYFLSYVLKEPQMYLMFFALISNSLIVLRLWDLRAFASFSMATVTYYIMFYMASLNLIRQYVAIALVFYATKYLSQGKYLKYIICVCVAGCFHQSALIGVLYIIFDVVAWKFLTKHQKNFMRVAFCSIPFVLIFLYKSMTQYMDYFNETNFEFGIMIIIKVLLLICSFLLLNKTENIVLINKKSVSTGYIHRTSVVSYILGLLLTVTGYVWKFVSRIGLYFYVFEPVYIGFVFKQKNTRNNLILKLMFVLVFIYQFFINMYSNGQGQHPYLFFWQ